MILKNFQVKDPQNYISLAADPHPENVVPGTPQIQIFECTKDNIFEQMFQKDEFFGEKNRFRI